MKTATVGSVQKNFAQVLKTIDSGESVLVTRRGEPVALITAPEGQRAIDWPDFYAEAVPLRGTPVSEVLQEERAERW